MTATVACPRCFRSVRLTEADWNAAEQCCTRCEPRSEGNLGGAPPHHPRRGGIGVRVTGLDVPFGNLVWFMAKLTFASIPAGLFVGLIIGIVYLVIRGFWARLGL